MSDRTQFWSVLGIFLLLVVGALGGVAWQAMESAPVFDKEAGHWLQQQIALIMLVGFCLGGVLVHIWGWLDKVLLKPLANVSQAMEIMAHADPLHAIILENTNLLGSLPAVAHQLGEALFHARRQVREALTNSTAQIERLEKVIKHLHVGLIIANADGNIILYNLAAQTLLRSRMDFMGLGRSLYDLLARMPVETTMELLIHSKTTADGIIQEGRRFLCAVVHDEMMLDCTMSLFPDEQATQICFIITFNDATRRLKAIRQSDQLIRHALENLHGPVANLQATAETRLSRTDRDAEIRKRLTQVIDAEGKKLALGLDAMAEDADALALEHWLLADVLTSDLLASLARQLAKSQGPTLLEIGEPLWIQADAPTLLLALTMVVQKIWEHTQVTVIEAQTLMGNNRIYLDFIWLGVPIPATEVGSWNQWVLADGEAEPRLKAILHRHVGEIWSQTHRRPGHAVLRLSVAPSPRQRPFPLQDVPERVEFYDFSLMGTFATLGLKLARSLGGLTYVVFDTETTGLNPSKGDEIIAIAAVRIVNGRILSGETFERLINPQRPIPSDSTRIHGITEADVQGMPTINEVLPAFRAFVADAVLVAHNAAFDLRFLQLKEASSGTRFDCPILDTLLLSVYLHEEATDHTLDAIARRLSVKIHHRHTAMGDTLVTAEIFLKQLDWLNAKGISTLGLAMKASESMVQIRRQQARANY